uniref:Putative secreted protein n=1 Tax=Anopheles triannulatus TaxID=58253 RepID=A0A2M4B434_9DIPT
MLGRVMARMDRGLPAKAYPAVVVATAVTAQPVAVEAVKHQSRKRAIPIAAALTSSSMRFTHSTSSLS